MNSIRCIVFAVLATVSTAAWAAAPTLKVSQSVVVHAPPATVWARIRDFDALNTWHPAVAKDQIVSGMNNRPGAVRLLTLHDGGTIKEKLLDFDDKHRRYKYEALEGVLPVSRYSSVLGVKADGKNRSKVTWSGTFQRKDTGPQPAADADDAAATKAVTAVYEAGLDHLKQLIEAK